MIAIFRPLAFGGVTLAALGLGAADYSALGVVGDEPNPDAPPASDPVAAPSADPGPSAPGNPTAPRDDEPSRPGPDANTAVSEIDRATTLIMIIPKGTEVRRDQLIAELDSAQLKDNLAEQFIATERAQADYQNSIKAREIAEFDVMTYLKGTYPLEEDEALGEIKLAKAELELAQELFKNAERLVNIASSGNMKKAQVDLIRAELNLGKAEKSHEFLRQYTKDRQVKALEFVVEQARSEERASQARFEHDKVTEERIRRMIEKCKVYAPADGILRYADEVDEGATVEYRQLLFWIEPADEADEDPAP